MKEYGEGAFEITDRYVNVAIPLSQDVIKSRGMINGVINGMINGAINGKLNDNEKDVAGCLILSPMAAYGEIASKRGISLRTATRVISDLQDRGIIKRKGARKKGKWKVGGRFLLP